MGRRGRDKGVRGGEQSFPPLQGRQLHGRGHWSVKAARAVQTLISCSLSLGGRVKF